MTGAAPDRFLPNLTAAFKAIDVEKDIDTAESVGNRGRSKAALYDLHTLVALVADSRPLTQSPRFP